MELKIKRENVIVPIVSALLIVIISNLKIDWYFNYYVSIFYDISIKYYISYEK